MAADTLIESVAVWRVPQEATNDFSSMKFYLARVDTTDGDPRKIIIQNGPSISVTVPDGSQPTRIQFDFNPPIQLPGLGQYALWVQVCSGYADLLIDGNNDFPGGHLYQSSRSDFSGCVLVGAKSFAQNLAFKVIFCASGLTPTAHGTWGSLKLRYR
jgi:hypothetical protein